MPTEIAFYEHVAQHAETLGQLRPFMPVCYGKLTLQGEEDGAGGVREVADSGSEVSIRAGGASESSSEGQRLSPPIPAP